MARQQLEISIAYTDKKGVKRYANRLGNLWLDTETMKGSIELPPGVSLHSGADFYINVQPPMPRDGAASRGQQPGGQSRQRQPAASAGEDDDLPF